MIVGFIHADPDNAVVLGMLYSSTKPLPIPMQDDNPEKGIITRSNLRIQFNDETKSISIDTPAGNSILLDESGGSLALKYQNGNTIIMERSGITLQSPDHITIKEFQP